MQTDYDNEDRPITKPRLGCLWNILTVFVLLGIICVVGVYGLIYSNPYVTLNPFPPPTMPAAISLNDILTSPTEAPSPTITLTIFPPTWTPVPTLTPTITSTPKPTVVFTTSTPFSLTPDAATVTDRPDLPFAVLGTPAAFSRTYIYPGADCNWQGVGGQVVDMQDAPIVGMTIKLGGMLDNKVIDMTGLTGTVLQYGTAGYEFTLGSQPVASHQTLWVQLLDQAGLPLSPRIFFDTYDDCQKNLVLITFQQVR